MPGYNPAIEGHESNRRWMESSTDRFSYPPLTSKCRHFSESPWSRWWIIGHVIIIIIICIDTSWWVVSQLPHCGSRCYHLLHRHALYLRCTFCKNLEIIHSMCRNYITHFMKQQNCTGPKGLTTQEWTAVLIRCAHIFSKTSFCWSMANRSSLKNCMDPHIYPLVN